MEKLQCELCNSIEFVRTDDGFFKCEYCGCKYTLEQARTILTGEVKVAPTDFVVRGGGLERYNGPEVDVVIPDNVTVIGKEAFRDCRGLKSVVIPDSVTSIDQMAFYNCSGLTSITIPNSVTSIGYGAFEYCSGLTSVTIPDSVTSIGMWAFHGCSGLTSITIPDSVTSIGMSAFQGCSGLTSITIPDSVTSIGDRAFSGCSSLTYITVPKINLGENVFYGSPIRTNRENNGLCTYCGNSGFEKHRFSYRCTKCGMKKIY